MRLPAHPPLEGPRGYALDRGELDLVTAIRPQPLVTAGDPTVIDRWGGTPIEGNPRIRKLFPDDGKSIVFDYYRKTGFFQPNHHVIVQNRILREHPLVALEPRSTRSISARR